jgi:hypothetical protein
MNGRRKELIQLAMVTVGSNPCSILVPTADMLSRRRTREAAMLKVRG